MALRYVFIASLLLAHVYSFSTPAKLLNLVEEKHFKSFKKFSIDHMDLKPGYKVLDLGPGPQASEIEMIAEIIGEQGQYIGIEGNEMDAAIANLKAKDSGVDQISKITYHFVEPGSPLPFADNTFDVSYASRVICQIDNHKYVLNEMIRVLKPGGVIVTTCHDSSSFSTNLFSLNEEAILKSNLQQEHPFPASFEFSKNSLQDFLDLGLVNRTLASWPLLDRDLLGKEYHEELYQVLYEEVKAGAGVKLAKQKLEELKDLVENDNFYFSLNFILSKGIKPDNWESREEKEEIKEFNEEEFNAWKEQMFKHIVESRQKLDEADGKEEAAQG